MKLPNVQEISEVQNTKGTNNYQLLQALSQRPQQQFNNHNSNYSVTSEKSVDVNADGRRVL